MDQVSREKGGKRGACVSKVEISPLAAYIGKCGPNGVSPGMNEDFSNGFCEVPVPLSPNLLKVVEL
jgi:hypothetical protein